MSKDDVYLNIRDLAGEAGWENETSEETFNKAADTLLEMGMPEEDSFSMLSGLYNATAAELGL